MRKECLVLFLFVGVVLARPTLAQKADPLQLVQTIPLPGVEGRIDHLAVDLKGQRLFIAALGNNTVEVVDLRVGKRAHTIQGLHEPQGVAFAPEVNRLFVSNGQGTGCDVFDGSTFKSLLSVALGDDSDNVRYDAGSKRILVGYGSGALGWIEAATGKHLTDVAFKGHPEAFQLENPGPRIFVNVPGEGQIVVVDRERRAVTARWPVTGAQSNFPMALDEADHRLFVGCRNPARILVYDTDSGKTVASVDIAGDTDDIFYDAARKRLYASCGVGFLSMLQQDAADHYVALARIPTAAGARTSLFVPQFGRLYLAVPHRGSQKAELRVFAVQP
ncbi:MAG: hypothetical protein JWL77_2167 [Chthonomonadaceae bacterium]|nr:hypothetical protein [Chthonomonadaceae bacterium]